MDTKTNNFFKNSTKINNTPTTHQQLTEHHQQQKNHHQHFLLALPIQSQPSLSSSSSSSFESTNSSSSSPTNSSSSLPPEKSKNPSSPPSPDQISVENSSILSPNPSIGSTIISPSTGTRYHLNRFLGQGTFSKVIQATCSIKSNQQSVALKLIRISSNSNSTPPSNLIYQDHIPTTDEAQFTRISTLREIEILKSIDHPSIIKLIETFSIPEQDTNSKEDSNDTIELLKLNSSLKVIVLEEIKGGELFELVSKSKHFLKPIIICRLMAELSIAVHWLHSNHIVHRDLKLENILLVREIKNEESTAEEMKRSRNVYIKLTDFGLSVKMTTDDKTMGSRNGLLRSRCGSEEYAAPELILGRMYDGRKTDAWALGVIGYSLVTGILPFKLPEPYVFKAQQDQVEEDKSNDLDYQMYLKKRKQGLLKIIKSEFGWIILQPNSNTGPFCRNDVSGQMDIVHQLLSRDPIKRPTDLLFGFRDPNWLGQFDWLKNLLLCSSDS